MDQDELLAYVSQRLPAELHLMQTGGYASAHPALTPQEKALIYYYTATGSTDINRLLHASQPNALTQQLILAMQKMPVYEGSAYSAADLSPALLDDLYAAFLTGDTALTAGK